MPTPFYHLTIAEDLCRHPALSLRVRRLCQQQSGAFLLGHTAPDVQSISRQPREATHFFALPLDANAHTPWQAMLEAFPQLATPSHLDTDLAAFICGYLCHLLADWLWIDEIFTPTFGPQASWGTFSQRLYLHNVLRSYLDLQVVPQLPAECGPCLAGCIPHHWLPFVSDEALGRWRDFLSTQLQPGAPLRTVEVFAAREGVSPARYYELLACEQEMDIQVFSRVPRLRLAQYRQRVIAQSLSLMENYFAEQPVSQWAVDCHPVTRALPDVNTAGGERRTPRRGRVSLKDPRKDRALLLRSG